MAGWILWLGSPLGQEDNAEKARSRTEGYLLSVPHGTPDILYIMELGLALGFDVC